MCHFQAALTEWCDLQFWGDVTLKLLCFQRKKSVRDVLALTRHLSSVNGFLTILPYSLCTSLGTKQRLPKRHFIMEQDDNNEINPDGSTAERRPELRRRMLKTAFASYNDQSISMPVVLRDMSETGAKIKLTSPDPLPDHFTLFVELDGITVDCQVVWRRGREVGARFISEIRHSAPLRVQKLQPSSKSSRISIRKTPNT